MYGIQHQVMIHGRTVTVQVTTSRGYPLTFDNRKQAEEFISLALLIKGEVIENLDCPIQSTTSKNL